MTDGNRPLLIVDSSIARRLDSVVLAVATDEPGSRSRFVLRGLDAS